MNVQFPRQILYCQMDCGFLIDLILLQIKTNLRFFRQNLFWCRPFKMFEEIHFWLNRKLRGSVAFCIFKLLQSIDYLTCQYSWSKLCFVTINHSQIFFKNLILKPSLVLQVCSVWFVWSTNLLMIVLWKGSFWFSLIIVSYYRGMTVLLKGSF